MYYRYRKQRPTRIISSVAFISEIIYAKAKITHLIEIILIVHNYVLIIIVHHSNYNDDLRVNSL